MSNMTYQLSYGDFLRFRDLIWHESGLHFSEKNRLNLEIGLLKALQTSPFDKTQMDAYYDYLKSAATPDAHYHRQIFINSLTCGETYFNRNTAHFNVLTKQVLPTLIAQKLSAAGSPSLRIWCAGCATGEEPYSVAMLLRQLIPDIEAWQILILATDINHDYLARARKGVYSDWSFRDEKALANQALYFYHTDQGYQIKSEIREMVTFVHHNLIQDEFPSSSNNTSAMDLILCRNVLIYFRPETAQQIVGKFYEVLTANGWLVLGHSESALTDNSAFKAHAFPDTLVFQKFAELSSVATASIERENREQGQSQKEQLLGQSDANLALSYLTKAEASANLGRWQEARTWCLEAIAVDALLPEAYLILALVDEHEGLIEQAITNLKKVIYLDRERPLPHFNLAVLYKKRNQIGLANQALTNVMQILQSCPPEKIILDSGYTSVQELSGIVKQMLIQNGVT